VADEGDGFTGGADLYTHAAAQTTAGLQKWVFNSATGAWAPARFGRIRSDKIRKAGFAAVASLHLVSA
jgi:hypothetical protein